jgi:hypothetical protein
MLAVILAIAMLGVACGSGGVEGKYRDSSGTFNAEFKDGKGVHCDFECRSQVLWPVPWQLQRFCERLPIR